MGDVYLLSKDKFKFYCNLLRLYIFVIGTQRCFKSLVTRSMTIVIRSGDIFQVKMTTSLEFQMIKNNDHD